MTKLNLLQFLQMIVILFPQFRQYDNTFYAYEFYYAMKEKMSTCMYK